jgi:hypothetical protein
MKRLAVLTVIGLAVAAGLAATFAPISSVSAGQQQGPKKPP